MIERMRIAFLRGINVGGHNVKKDVLCDVFEGLDLTAVRTFIASGNVMFDGGGAGPSDAAAGADLEVRIAAALEQRLGWAVATFVRSPAEVGAMVGWADARAELAPAAGETLQIGLLHQPPPAPAAGQWAEVTTPTDLLLRHERELYWLCRGPVHKSKVTNARLERAGGGPVTFRNITTMRRLIEASGA
jgi:uncharacterized protein (DUF1697 family)